MERRDFIKGGALAAAGITILPTGTLFAKDTQKVRLGYIGAVSYTHLDVYKRQDHHRLLCLWHQLLYRH